MNSPPRSVTGASTPPNLTCLHQCIFTGPIAARAEMCPNPCFEFSGFCTEHFHGVCAKCNWKALEPAGTIWCTEVTYNSWCSNACEPGKLKCKIHEKQQVNLTHTLTWEGLTEEKCTVTNCSDRAIRKKYLCQKHLHQACWCTDWGFAPWKSGDENKEGAMVKCTNCNTLYFMTSPLHQGQMEEVDEVEDSIVDALHRLAPPKSP